MFPLTTDETNEYLHRLAGPEGCNFPTNPESLKDVTWVCKGGFDKGASGRILTEMGLDDDAVAEVHRFAEEAGGHCDCEILFNAAPRMFEAAK